MKMSRKMKKMFNFYNLAIILCVIIIIVAVIIIFKPNKEKKISTDGVEIVQSNLDSEEKISEDEAKKLAIKQFKKIGETDLKADELQCMKIQRKGEEYYYITSKNNTLEIKILGGEVTRINSVVVEYNEN